MKLQESFILSQMILSITLRIAEGWVCWWPTCVLCQHWLGLFQTSSTSLPKTFHNNKEWVGFSWQRGNIRVWTSGCQNCWAPTERRFQSKERKKERKKFRLHENVWPAEKTFVLFCFVFKYARSVSTPVWMIIELKQRVGTVILFCNPVLLE